MWFGQLTTHIPGILVHLHKGRTIVLVSVKLLLL